MADSSYRINASPSPTLGRVEPDKVAVQQLESHVISPLVLHRTVKLHPAAVLLALLAGASLGGIFGMIVAAPAVAALKVVIGHVWTVYVLGQPPEDPECTVGDLDPRDDLLRQEDGVTSGPGSATPGPDARSPRPEAP